MARRRRKDPEPAPTPVPGSLAALLEDFLEASAVAGYAAETVRVRRRNLLDFCAWCQQRGIIRPAEVTRPVLLRYQRHLYHYRKRNGRPLGWSSQHGRLVAIRAFFKWLVMESHLLFNPASELALPRRPPRLPKAVLSAREAEAVLTRADPATPTGLRDRAVLEVLYSTGLRRSELVDLEVFDLDLTQRLVRVRSGKGGKERVIPVGERAAAWVGKYLAEARPVLVAEPDDGVLFVSDHGRRFHPQYLSRRVKEYVDAAELGKSGSCHLFRHTMATLMLEGGADIRFIQQMLGHAEISTTQIYTRVSVKKLQEIHARTHPARLERRRELREREADEPEPTAEDLLAELEAEADEEEEAGGG